jgi:hypothetical protein
MRSRSKPLLRSLKQRGFALLHEARAEPWGQTVARLQPKRGCDYRPVVRAVNAPLTEQRAP